MPNPASTMRRMMDLRPIVEGGHGRQDNGADFRRLRHCAQMAEMQRRFARQQTTRRRSLSCTSAAHEGLVDAIDRFCDSIGFIHAQTARVLEMAR